MLFLFIATYICSTAATTSEIYGTKDQIYDTVRNTLSFKIGDFANVYTNFHNNLFDSVHFVDTGHDVPYQLVNFDEECLRSYESTPFLELSCVIPYHCHAQSKYLKLDGTWFGKHWGVCHPDYKGFEMTGIPLTNLYKLSFTNRTDFLFKHETFSFYINYHFLYDLYFVKLNNTMYFYNNFCYIFGSHSNYRYKFDSSIGGDNFYYDHMSQQLYDSFCRNHDEEMFSGHFSLHLNATIMTEKAFKSPVLFRPTKTHYIHGAQITFDFGRSNEMVFLSGNGQIKFFTDPPTINYSLITDPIAVSYMSKRTGFIAYVFTYIIIAVMGAIWFIIRTLHQEVFSTTSVYLYPFLKKSFTYILYSTFILELTFAFSYLYYKTKNIILTLYIFAFIFAIFAYFYYLD